MGSAAGAIITVGLVAGSFSLIARVFKLLCLALLAYVVEVFLVHVSWGTVLSSTFVPHFHLTRAYLALLIAVLGTTMSPYLFFWQSAHRVEELREAPEGGNRAVPLKEHSRRSARAKQGSSRIDVFSGMALSNLVMWAIILVTAQTLASHGQHHIQSAAEAAGVLTPIAGRFASALFALGFIGSGILGDPGTGGSGGGRDGGPVPQGVGLLSVDSRGSSVLRAGRAGQRSGARPSAWSRSIRLVSWSSSRRSMASSPLPFLIVVMLISGDRQASWAHTATAGSHRSWVG